MDHAGVTLVRSGPGAATWELATREPDPALAGPVGRYCGYVERSALAVQRRELPGVRVPLILSFHDPIEISTADVGAARFTSFTAGLTESPTLTRYAGTQYGIQVDLTPLASYRLLGIPGGALAGAVVGVDRLDLPWLAALPGRLAALPTWEARFAELDRTLRARAAAGPRPHPAVAWAWRRLAATHGRVPVGDLAGEIGWSRRHLVARFREQVGVAPKAAGRLLRFDHAMRLLSGPDMVRSISDLAARAGYADHSHLDREFRRLAGRTPTELRAERSADGMVQAFAADPEVTFVQATAGARG